MADGEQEGEHRGDADSRADRRWAELLQEVRVAQTGVQILLGFLLSVAFTPRFARLGDFDRTVYVITVVLGAATTGALIAPVSVHRMLSGHRLKPELVHMAARLTTVGMLLLALTLGSTLLLLLHVAAGLTTACCVVAAVTAWYALCWLLLPVWIRRHAERFRTDRR